MFPRFDCSTFEEVLPCIDLVGAKIINNSSSISSSSIYDVYFPPATHRSVYEQCLDLLNQLVEL